MRAQKVNNHQRQNQRIQEQEDDDDDDEEDDDMLDEESDWRTSFEMFMHLINYFCYSEDIKLNLISIGAWAAFLLIYYRIFYRPSSVTSNSLTINNFIYYSYIDLICSNMSSLLQLLITF